MQVNASRNVIFSARHERGCPAGKLPPHRGACQPLAVVTRCQSGNPQGQATYPQLLATRRCRFVVVVLEVNGRFGTELADFHSRMEASKVRAATPRLRAASHHWAAMLALRIGRTGAMARTEPSLADLRRPRADQLTAHLPIGRPQSTTQNLGFYG